MILNRALTARDRLGWLSWGMGSTKVMWLMIACYLVIDTLNGFFAQQLGLDLKISQLFKLSMIFLGLYILLCWKSRFTSFLVLFFAILIFAPLVRLLTDPGVEFFSYDLAMATRIFLTMVVLCFCIESRRREPKQFRDWSRLSLTIGFWIVAVNVLSGYLGLGFPTYPSTGTGFKGFFQAGNEVSAVFILLSTYMLHLVWNEKSLMIYVAFSLFIMLIGISIATKAGVLFSAIIVLLTPIANMRARLLSLQSFLFFIILCLALFSMLYFAFEWLSSMPFYSRMSSKFSQMNWLTFILSGRDVFVSGYWQSINDINGFFTVFFGDGGNAMSTIFAKNTVEMDPIDIYMYFGFPSLMIAFSISAISIYLPLERLNSGYYAPGILLANGGLFFFAVLAGHVWSSAMLGIAWACFNAMLTEPNSRSDD